MNAPQRPRRPLDSLLLRSCAAFVLFAAATASTAQVVSLRQLPEVSLEAAEPAVREQLAQQREALNELLQSGTEVREEEQRRQLAAAYGALGQLYVLYDLSLAAEAALGNAIELAPEEPRWRYLLATTHQLDNRLDAAIAGYRAVLDMQPDDAAARLRLGDVLLRAERTEAAAAEYRKVLNHPTANAAALYGMGRVAATQGDHETAARRFADALQAQPEADQLHYHLGVAYRELGDADRARFHFENRGDREVAFPDPIALELQQLAGGVGAMLSLGRISLAMGEDDAAEERFRKALEIDPQSSSALKSLASVLQKRGELGEALQFYEQAITAEPDDAALRFFVAQMIDEVTVVASDDDTAQQQRSALDERAAGHLEAALEIAPDFVPAWVLLADIEERGGDLDGAQEALESAIAVGPNQFDLHYLMAQLLAKRGQAGAGLEALRRFDAGLAEANRPLATIGRIERAELLLQLGQFDEGTGELEKLAVDQDAEARVRARAQFALGNHATAQGDGPAAISWYSRSLGTEPSALTAFNLGTMLGREARFDDAAAAFEQARTIDPQSHRARFSEAMALLMGERYGDARQRLEAALQAFPSMPSYALLLTQILVTAPDEAVRDAEIGLDLASRLFDAVPSTEHGQALAMAFAASGRFDKAVEWQERIVSELAAAPEGMRAIAQRRLEAYRRGELAPPAWR